jgi:uncharacterized glyoxalase superfamily protein PhnB
MKKKIFILIDILLIITAVAFWDEAYQAYQAQVAAQQAAQAEAKKQSDQNMFMYCIQGTTIMTPDEIAAFKAQYQGEEGVIFPSFATSTENAAQDCFNQFSNNNNSWNNMNTLNL